MKEDIGGREVNKECVNVCKVGLTDILYESFGRWESAFWSGALLWLLRILTNLR